MPPLVLAPVVPGYMWVRLVARGRSLRRAGLRLWRVFLMPTARGALPAPLPVPTEQQLQRLAPREVLEGPHGAAIRRAAHDRAAILEIVARLSKADRALLPDIAPTVDALVARVAHLAEMLDRLDGSFDPQQGGQLDARIERLSREPTTPETERRLELMRRQRATLQELQQRRETMATQLENAGLALGSLRLDLIRVRSGGLQAGSGGGLSGVATATQQAKALSLEIGAALDAVAEVRAL
jgi:serine/threonine-protein kinase